MKPNNFSILVLLYILSSQVLSAEINLNQTVFSKLMFGVEEGGAGVIWYIKAAPVGFEEWNSRTLLSKQLLIQENKKTVKSNRTLQSVIVVFSSKTVKDDIRTNPNCHACPSLISIGVFRKKLQKWTLRYKNIFLVADGAWGEPPNIKIVNYYSDSKFSLRLSGEYTSTGSSTLWAYEMAFSRNHWIKKERTEETINTDPVSDDGDL